MKVASRHQIYLEYLLPRDDTWTTLDAGVQIDTDAGFRAILRPRGDREDLYPEDIDRTLSTLGLKLSPLGVLDAEINLRVADRVMDRVEVTLTLQLDDGCDWAEETDRAVGRAAEITDGFLAHCRVAARSPFVRPLARGWRQQDRRFYVMAPNTVAWFDAGTGEPLPVLNGVNARASSGAVLSPVTGTVSTALLSKSLQSGQEPPVVESLLVDAQANVNGNELREAVLALASALEVASNLHMNRSGAKGTQAVKDALGRSRISFAERRFHLLTTALEGRSLADDDPGTFADVEVTYRARNALMHDGRFGTDLATLRGEDRAQRIQELIASAYRVVAWLGL